MSTYEMKDAADGCRLSVHGALTAVLVPELQRELRERVERGVREIVFDLGDTSMVDSSGIGLLIATSNSLAQKNGKLAVVNTAPEVLKLLRSMRLATRLNISGAGERKHE